MRWSHKLLLILALTISSTLAFAQGSAGGYGQTGRARGFDPTQLGAGGGPRRGGSSGGFSGGGGAANGPLGHSKDDKQSRPDEDESEALWVTKAAILTPGDRVEYKFKLRKGDTLLAGATSDAFDPALAVEDAKGKTLTKNDDRVEGDQSPLVICRVPEDGTYTLKVLSFRSVSGGKFTVKMRTFRSVPSTLGKLAYQSTPTTSENIENGRIVFRLALNKNKVYDLRTPFVKQDRNRYALRLDRVVGPTGVEVSDFTSIPSADGSEVMRALADGDYYFEYQIAVPFSGLDTDYREVSVLPAKINDDQSIPLEPREAKIIEFPVAPNQMVRTTLAGKSFIQLLSAPDNEKTQPQDGDGEAFGTTKAFTWFRMNQDSDLDNVRVFHGEGTARLVIRSTAGAPETVTLKNVASLASWDTTSPQSGTLQIGDARVYLIKSTKSELMRVNATADHFQPKLEIFRLSGERANALMDRKTHTAGDDLYFPDEDTFLVRFSCDGDGGSGAFAMNRASLTPSSYTLGTPQELKLDGINFGLYSVDLEAGKRYELLSDDGDNYMRADLLDDDGQFLNSSDVSFGKVVARYFVPTKSGRHRLWLRGAPGTRHFTFRIHVPPSIGG